MKVKILGKTWTIKVLTDKKFNTLHTENIEACAMAEKREIHFRKGFTEQTTTHEIAHAYFSGLCVDSANLEQGQLEDVACDLLANYGEEAIKLSKQIFKRLSS